jgi:nucleotide-binding universal stress UspA family protein
MISNVLLPVDGSTFSEHALPFAAELARRTGARLHIVQVHETPIAQAYPDGMPVQDPGWDGALRARSEEYLRSLAHQCMARTGIGPVTELLDGPVAPALAAYASEVGVDLIVMTTHGRGGISRAWVGSVADALVRSACVPIYLIRPKEQEIDWTPRKGTRHVLIPLDGSELAEAMIPAATALGVVLDARYTLLRVVLPVPFLIGPQATGPSFTEGGALAARELADGYLHEVAGRLRARGADVATDVVLHTVPALAILDYAATHSVDLIAMATHGRGGWSRLALGSVADKVMRGTMMPVLLYRPAAGAATTNDTTSAATGEDVEQP